MEISNLSEWERSWHESLSTRSRKKPDNTMFNLDEEDTQPSTVAEQVAELPEGKIYVTRQVMIQTSFKFLQQQVSELPLSELLYSLEIGYRHFDTTKIYGLEEALGTALGQAISYGTVQREDIFVTSKLWYSDHHDPISAPRQTLKTVGLEYLDSYLVHWSIKLKPGVIEPIPKEYEFEKDLGIEETWQGMERCLEMDLCRSIGVSNFSEILIQEITLEESQEEARKRYPRR